MIDVAQTSMAAGAACAIAQVERYHLRDDSALR